MEHEFDFISWTEKLCMIWRGTAEVEEESKERSRIKKDSEADIIQNHIQDTAIVHG